MNYVNKPGVCLEPTPQYKGARSCGVPHEGGPLDYKRYLGRHIAGTKQERERCGEFYRESERFIST